MSRPNQSEIAKRFGKNLQSVMKNLDLTGASLSEKTGLTPAAISQILSGKREPLLSTVIRIMNVIPVSFERLTRP